MSKLVIAIDAGHGVNGDPGAVHKSGRRECDDTLRFALAVDAEAKRRGFGTVMTRTLANSPAIDRAGIAKSAGAGVFLCIHRNAFNGAAKGFETWTSTSYSAKTNQLAQAVQNRCAEVGVLANRGVKRDTNNNYSLISSVEWSGIPAILVEYGFVDNTEDNAIFDKNFDGYVKATVQAVVDVFGEPEQKGSDNSGFTAIAGKAVASIEQMRAYLTRMNPNAPDIASMYIAEGEIEGIRGDIAFAQSCLETGFFKFSGGTAVTLEQNNFCGMGVTTAGARGNSYASVRDGIRAQIQHLKAYANDVPLVNPLVVPTVGESRFKFVVRGCAPYVEWLGQKENPQGRGWAVGAGYGGKILQILRDIIGAGGDVSEPPTTSAFAPYRVRVTTDALNIRERPGTGNKSVGKIKDRGVYTIVGEANATGAKRWGKLKSGVGWISLDWTERV